MCVNRTTWYACLVEINFPSEGVVAEQYIYNRQSELVREIQQCFSLVLFGAASVEVCSVYYSCRSECLSASEQPHCQAMAVL